MWFGLAIVLNRLRQTNILDGKSDSIVSLALDLLRLR